MSFLGYPRPDGAVGTRNYVLVIPQGIISRSICDFVPGTKTLLTADHGSGRTANDRETVARVLIGLGRNPNVSSVILHAASPGAGYPELRVERLADEIASSGKRVEVLDPAKDGGTYGAIISADDFLSELRDAETGQRGYSLTGDELFLEPYLAVRDKISDHLREIRRLKLDAGAQKHLDALEPLVEAKLEEMSHGIELRRNH
ncbi:MAG: hypothetical protein HGB17_17310, partial [Syntrophobacteraceae bacterium]|nr:hypothetical protein [Syntrophobacteraceae bacterium]